MNNKEADYRVYVTSDYSIFKHLKENRDVTERRIEKIRKSIDSVGYVRNPILVNEKMEIIDGQGRFEVLKEKGYPIEYIIDEGIGVDECRAMNVQQTNWTVMDFVDSFCASGNEDYLNLRRLVDKYGMFNLATISVEKYESLIDLKARVDVVVEIICCDGYIRVEDVLRILNTEKSLTKLDELRIKDETEMAQLEIKFGKQMEDENLWAK